MARKPIYTVMLSSTYKELEDHRKAVSAALLSQEMFPLAMENDAALADHDLISASLEKVDKAEAYIGLISYRYGQTPRCPQRNPDGLSLTELEFRRAVERKIPICMFPMSGKHSITTDDAIEAAINADKLAAFKSLARNNRIYAEFLSVEDLKTKAVQSLVQLREVLDRRRKQEATDAATPAQPDDLLPLPPTLHAAPPYLPSHDFVGRRRELDLISEWVRSSDPLLVFEAIGGMGKSMLTWRWLHDHAPRQRPDWAGLLWYSFYETGADMQDFCVTALAYMTRRPKAAFQGRKTADLAGDLVRQLQAKPWLLVLDGLERVLVAYNRHDAAQAADDAVETDPDTTKRPPESCIRPEDDDLLQRLTAANPSKLLVSSRLMPRALLNNAGVPRPGVHHIALTGLAPEDAELMMRAVGVRGEGGRMRAYLQDQFGCHPLVVGVVAGLVSEFPPAPGDFDRWVDDPTGGDEVNLAKLNLTERRNHILAAAFRDLDPHARDLLGHLAFISDAVLWEDLEALNPRRLPPPVPVDEPTSADDGWYLRYHEERLSAAQSADERKERAETLAAVRRMLDEEHSAAQAAFATYVAERRAWEQSEALRKSRRWLNETLLSLQRRGLLQCDRQTARYDLHPVVRHYSAGALTAEARGATAERVADHFASRPEPAYASARTLRDLANTLHVVRALNSGGRAQRAFEALRGGLTRALFRLERHHERLALLRPLFREGWKEPIGGLEDPGAVATDAARALHGVGRTAEAAPLHVFSILDFLKKDDLGNACDSLLVFSNTVGVWSPARAERALRLALEIAEADQNDFLEAWYYSYLCGSLLERGEVSEARSAWEAGGLDAVRKSTPDDELRGELTVSKLNLARWEGRLDSTAFDEAIKALRSGGETWQVRRFFAIKGNWAQEEGDHALAIESFDDALAMAREVRIASPDIEVARALSLLRLNQEEEARRAVARVEEAGEAPHDRLAAFYAALGDFGSARAHALKGYEYAWADGPPFAFHWELERCREVLRTLGEPEPELPPFDPARVEPFPFEAEIRAMLERHAAKQRQSEDGATVPR